MSSEWKEYYFEDVSENFDKKRVPLSSAQRSKKQGIYPYYGAQGVIDFIDDYIFNGTYLLIAEDGENLKSKKQQIARLAHGKFWVNNHAHIVLGNNLSDISFLCYKLNSMDISGYVTGSAQPKLSQQNMNHILLEMPPLAEQKAIAAVLSALDDKIELNNRINKNLEAQAQAIFKSWFVDFEPFRDGEFVDSELGPIPKGWRVGQLGSIAEISTGKRPALKCDHHTATTLVPIIGASGIMAYTNKPLLSSKIIVTGRVGTHGVIQRYHCPIWVSDNAFIIKTNFYEYTYQIFKNINYSKLNRGSTQPLITQTDLKNEIIIIPPDEVLILFEKIICALLARADHNNLESKVLANLRDTLLPKLMSGEIRVPLEV